VRRDTDEATCIRSRLTVAALFAGVGGRAILHLSKKPQRVDELQETIQVDRRLHKPCEIKVSGGCAIRPCATGHQDVLEIAEISMRLLRKISWSFGFAVLIGTTT